MSETGGAGGAGETGGTALADCAIPFLPKGVRLKFDKTRGCWFLLAPERALKLDEIGAAILSGLEAGGSFQGLSETLAGKYGAPYDQVREDAGSFLVSLINRRMVETR